MDARPGQWTGCVMVTVVCKESVGGQNTGLRPVVGNSGKGQCGRWCREARVQAGMIQGKNIKMGCVWP